MTQRILITGGAGLIGSHVAEQWFDRIIKTLEPFHLTITFCFTPECEGITPHYTSAPRVLANYADFCARMVRRYAA